jgi:hypothetical protein
MVRKILCLLYLTLALQNCHQKSEPFVPKGPLDVILTTPNGGKLKTKVVFSIEDHTKGLSGIPSFEFASNQAMLFYYEFDSFRSFWMPDTYFDLDIFFLSDSLEIIDIEKNVPHHPGRTEPPAIARTKVVECRHVLEIRSDSPIGKKLSIGDKLNWISTPRLEQIKLETHL